MWIFSLDSTLWNIIGVMYWHYIYVLKCLAIDAEYFAYLTLVQMWVCCVKPQWTCVCVCLFLEKIFCGLASSNHVGRIVVAIVLITLDPVVVVVVTVLLLVPRIEVIAGAESAGTPSSSGHVHHERIPLFLVVWVRQTSGASWIRVQISVLSSRGPAQVNGAPSGWEGGLKVHRVLVGGGGGGSD